MTCWQTISISGERVAMYSNRGVDHRESLVAGPGVVSAVLFEMAQERDDPLEREITDRQLGEL